MEKIVEVKNLDFSYGDISIFKDFSLDIEKGAFYTILGSTGSGKSTLCRLLFGLEPVYGYMKIFNLYSNPKNHNEIQRRIGYISNYSFYQMVADTVYQELSFPLQELNYRTSVIDKKVQAISSELGITELLHRNPKELSIGEKQLVALASCLIRKIELLILDDALSMLDNKRKKKIFSILKKYQKKNNLTILHFSSNVEDILEGSSVIILSEGKVALKETLTDSLHSEKIFLSNHLTLPFLPDLSNKLRYYKIIQDCYVDELKLVDALWK